MLNLPYSLVIEATDDPTFFGFYSEELPGFSGVGHSVEGCLCKARHGMAVPPDTARPTVLIHDSTPAAA